MSTSTLPCTCPTGDGSLRWPCPQHPPAAATPPAVPAPAGGVATTYAEPAAVLTVITCRCGTDVDGFSEAAAWHAYEDHLAQHDDEDADQ